MGNYEIALRLSARGVTAASVTSLTLPLGFATRQAEAMAAASRERNGRARAEVEAALRARVQATSANSSRFGRERREGNP